MQLLTRWWFVPIVLLFTACVALKLHGSSIGRWQQLQREPEPIRGLLTSTPKTIRSDEWVVWTPSILSQAQQKPPFPIANANLGAGRAPLLMSVPVAYYTTLFRPQLWGFFFLDLERAFSFYWCVKVFALLLATMWLLRQLGIRSRVIIVSGALVLFFSSFTQWWFSTPAMLPEMVASWAICLGCLFTTARSTATRLQVALSACGFLFFGVNFVLCLYPPFQIPLVLLGAMLLLGFWLEHRRGEQPLRMRRALLLLGGGTAAMLAVLVPFWLEVRSTLEIVAQTEYPAGRVNTGGGYSLGQLFAGPIGFFEDETKVPLGFPNIAEASNFYPLWLLALLGAAVAKWRTRVAFSPLLLLLAAFIVAISVYCTVPLPRALLRATLFSQVHEARALLALGIANVLLVCWFLDRYRQPIFGRWWAWLVALGGAVGVAVVLHAVHAHDAEFFADPTRLALLILANGTILVLFSWDRLRRFLLPAVALLLLAGNSQINPTMRGLGALTESSAYVEIARLHAADPEAKWIVFDDYVFGQLAKAAGASVFNGTKVVPDLPLMRELDPTGALEQVYNRYAWIICSVQVYPEQVGFSLQQAEFYTVHLPPGLPFLRENGYDYYVFPAPWRDAVFYDFKQVAQTAPDGLSIYRRVR